jgi:C4-dicarboxylate transporter, DctQ subunit
METRRSRIETSIDVINSILAATAAIMIVFMMLSICYSVLVRFIWGTSVPWIVEISSYLMLYITFLCMAWLQSRDGHVRIDLFTSKLGTRARAALDVFTSLGGAVIGFILAWKGALVTLDYFRRDVTVIGILDTPQYLLLAIIPVGGALLLLESILRTWSSFRAVRQKDGLPQGEAS